MTAVMEPNSPSESFWSTMIDPAAGSSTSFDRCVDWLLTMHEATDDAGVQMLIVDVLADLRALGSIDADFEDVVLGALASIDVAFEISTLS